MTFNCNPTLSLEFHIIKHLGLQILLVNSICKFKKTIGKS